MKVEKVDDQTATCSCSHQTDKRWKWTFQELATISFLVQQWLLWRSTFFKNRKWDYLGRRRKRKLDILMSSDQDNESVIETSDVTNEGRFFMPSLGSNWWSLILLNEIQSLLTDMYVKWGMISYIILLRRGKIKALADSEQPSTSTLKKILLRKGRCQLFRVFFQLTEYIIMT